MALKVIRSQCSRSTKRNVPSALTLSRDSSHRFRKIGFDTCSHSYELLPCYATARSNAIVHDRSRNIADLRSNDVVHSRIRAG
jgi:hypothetical protein